MFLHGLAIISCRPFRRETWVVGEFSCFVRLTNAAIIARKTDKGPNRVKNNQLRTDNQKCIQIKIKYTVITGYFEI